MRADEIERFFAARVVGTDALAMAIHEALDGPTDRHLRLQPARRRQRLRAVPHHDRREGCVGPGLRHRGDPADARPRLRDARPAPHRALRVRVQRARDPRVRRCGFVVEGRSRESIWRDGRWWDELAMSVLESDWRRRRVETDGETPQEHDGLVDAVAAEAVDRAVEDGSAPADRRRPRTGLDRDPATDHAAVAMTATGAAADAARAEVRELIAAKGHTVDNARAAVDAAGRRVRRRLAGADAGAGHVSRRPRCRARAGRGREARRQDRRGRPIHPARDRPRARPA